MEHDGIAVEQRDGVTRLVLDRPERRNALSLAMLQELTGALEGLGEDSRVVVLGAKGPVFSAGHDMTEMVGVEESHFDRLFQASARLAAVIHEIPQPVIARVQGPATAAGCQLVASCDLAIAVDTAWFATPGVQIGLFCTTPMVPVSRSVGGKRALQMLLTGEPIGANTAVEWGLINQAVPEGELDTAVDALVEKILRYSPAVIGLGKRTFYRQAGRPEREAYEMATPVMAGNAAMPHAQEGMRAFLEKRTPRWPDGRPETGEDHWA